MTSILFFRFTIPCSIESFYPAWGSKYKLSAFNFRKPGHDQFSGVIPTMGDEIGYFE